MLMPTKIEEAFAHLGAILMQTAASDDKIIIGHVRDAHGLLQDVLRAPSPRAPSEDDDWKDDPSADERWQAGLDFGLLELCAVLDVKPHDVTWDAATETLDGDVSAVIGNILRAKYGEDFDPTSPAPTAAPTLGREADCDCGAATSGKWSGIHSEGCSAMRETTGIDDVEWLDAKVVELSKENERLRAALTAPDKGGPDHRAALIRISDLDWAWNVGAILSGKTFRPDKKIAPPLTPQQVMTIRKIGYALPAAKIAEIIGTTRTRVDRIRKQWCVKPTSGQVVVSQHQPSPDGET
jgi:hypothetical protein